MPRNDYGFPTDDLDDMDDFPPPSASFSRCPKPVEHDPERRATDRLATLLGIENAEAKAIVGDIILAAKHEIWREEEHDLHARRLSSTVSG